MKFSIILFCLALLVPATSWAQATATGNAQSIAGAVTNAPVTNFNSSAQPPQVPMTTSPPLMQPQIFGGLQRTAAGASVGVIAGYLKVCQAKFTRQAKPEVRTVMGKSERTKLVFFPHPTYLGLERNKDSVQVEEVTPPTFSLEAISGVVCLGSVTAFSQDGATTGFETVVADISNFPFDNMKGIRDVVIVAIPDGIAMAGGVASSGSSFGLGGALSHVVSALTAGAITPSFSKGGGESKPQEWLGGTFILLGAAPNGTNMMPSDFGALFKPSAPGGGPGNNGAKVEATK